MRIVVLDALDAVPALMAIRPPVHIVVNPLEIQQVAKVIGNFAMSAGGFLCTVD